MICYVRQNQYTNYKKKRWDSAEGWRTGTGEWYCCCIGLLNLKKCTVALEKNDSEWKRSTRPVHITIKMVGIV